MKMSRIVAVILVLAAVGWIASGTLGKADRKAQAERRAGELAQVDPARFKVSVMPASVDSHARRIVLSGRTEADRRAVATTRGPGVIVALNVRRGSVVKTGDVVAVLSDDAREAMVDQAKARLEQRQIELRARMRLIETGNMALINKPQMEAEMKAAEAALAVAEAERDKAKVLAPIDGIVNDVPVEVGQALLSGTNVADVIAVNPMLAVVEIAERQLGGVKPGDRAKVKLVTGETAGGVVRFVSRKASQQTRTYRVEVNIDNPMGTIPDGVTCEVSLSLAAVPATRVPRSALTFSSAGKLGVRTVDANGKVAFVPVTPVEDMSDQLWVTGIADGARIIVQGQDFVKEGETVDTVPAQRPAQS